MPSCTMVRHLHCGEGGAATIEDGETAYALTDMNCPDGACDSLAHGGPQIVTADDPTHGLLATYHSYFEMFVTLWAYRDGVYEPILMLNSDGYVLEFTTDGKYLRARNVNGWKVYAVADILNAVKR